MKPIVGAIGFMMMFFSPAEELWAESIWKAVGIQLSCFAVAIALLAYAGAFKRSTSNTSKP